MCNQGCLLSKYFPLQVPKHMKNYIFWISWFLFKLILRKLKCSFGKIAKKVLPKVQQVLDQISKRINKINCWHKSKNSSTDSDCSFDNSAEKLSSKIKFSSALSPKLTKKLVFARALILFKMILRTGRMECTSDKHVELFQQQSNTFLCKV